MTTLLNWANKMVEEHDDFGYLLRMEIEKVITDETEDIEIALTDDFKYTISDIVSSIDEEIEYYENAYSYGARGYFNTMYDIERLQWCKEVLTKLVQDLENPPKALTWEEFGEINNIPF